MPREFVPVKTEIVKRYAGPDTETKQTHPAFVQVRLSRVTGSFKCYGSALPEVNNVVELTVTESAQYHSLGRDWHHSDTQLLQVQLSAAQFAEMITTLNVGGGVCGTLQRFNGKQVPQIPFEHETEATRVVDDFKAKLEKTVDKLNKFQDRVSEILAKKTLTKADKEEIEGEIHQFAMALRDNAPFAVESFQEAAEKTVSSAKAEVDAFMAHAVQTAGLQAIAEGRLPTALLGNGEKK